MKQNQKKRNLTKTIRVAILADEPFFWGSRKLYHRIILNNYTWRKNGIEYIIKAEFIYDKDIINHQLIPSQYDVLLVPGGGVGNNQALMKGFTFIPKVKKFKQAIATFVKQGGGYIGICGGAAFCTNLQKELGEKPKTTTERLYHKSSLHISCVSSYFKHLAFPLFYIFQHAHPEHVGNSAYAFSFAPGLTQDGIDILTVGCPLDIHMNTDNPLFQDVSMNINRIRWWAGQGLIVNTSANRSVYVLATFPPVDVSENASTQIHAWRYTGGITGIIKAMIQAGHFLKKHNIPLSNLPIFTYYLAGDWEQTDTIVHLNLNNKPCMTAEIYPNEHQGRIILSTVHPEYMIWHGGRIEEVDNDEFHCIGKGFHRWKEIENISSSLEEELTSNWWILRRFIAWAAKVPDSDLPPVENGVVTKEVRENIISKILWDGSILHQMKNI